ncbi:MAG: hypothetical protein IPP19_08930 [Verrucomicrobia bacterium]|nr:hypothetical protein [Verrucomicrobiota bacterium]
MYKPDLNEQQTRVLLEGLSCMELHLQALIKKTTDQDDRIDISNDLLYVASLRKQMETDASKVFGPGVLVQLYPKSE